MNSICFKIKRDLEESILISHKLQNHYSKALSELIPILSCGEESAALIFNNLANILEEKSEARQKLLLISQEEIVHEKMLRSLANSLPPPKKDLKLRRKVKLFFLSIQSTDLGKHFAQIAALDSGVCIILSHLRRKNGPIYKEKAINNILSTIHREEARHAAISIDFAKKTLSKESLRNIFLQTRFKLNDLIINRKSSFETLKVNSTQLGEDLLEIPQFL